MTPLFHSSRAHPRRHRTLPRILRHRKPLQILRLTAAVIAVLCQAARHEDAHVFVHLSHARNAMEKNAFTTLAVM